MKGLSTITLALVACLTSPTARAQDTTILTDNGADRQQRLEEGARKEGALMFYSALTIDQGLRAIVDGFMKKYPFVKTEFWRGTELQIVQTPVLAPEREQFFMGPLLDDPVVTVTARDNGVRFIIDQCVVAGR